jgi:C4-dicarboxylate-specific signal transduction histidine kinase
LPDTSQFGLGLSVAAGIAHDHGGSLQTESDENGGGYLLRVAVAEPGR